MDEQDGELLDRYLKGEVPALEELVEKYRRRLYGFVLNMTAGREDADEIFQEVWLRAIRGVPCYKQRNFFGWLVRIAHNLVIDRARRRRPTVSLDEETDDGRTLGQLMPSQAPDPGGLAEAGDLGRRIAQAVAALPAQQKETFLLRVQAGLSFKEIAAVQRVSINTALARMQYALAKLRPLLKHDYKALGR
jgi:RNA polymerase sigma-70 factor, ECF subfamily